MQLQNISASVITLAGSYTLQSNTTMDIPYNALEDDRNFLSYVDAQQLRVITAEESFTLASLPRFTQGQVVTPQTLTVGETYTPVVNNGSATPPPVTLWLAPFQYSRLYLNVTSGDMTVTIQDSPDGGTTFFPVPEAGSISASATDANGGKASMLLPQGLCLVQFIFHSTGGGTASLSFSRQS